MSAWRGHAATHLSQSAMPLYLAQREQTHNSLWPGIWQSSCLKSPCGRAWVTAACGELGGRHNLDLSLSRPRRPSPTRPCIKPSPAFTSHGVTTEQGGVTMHVPALDKRSKPWTAPPDQAELSVAWHSLIAQPAGAEL